MQHDNLFANNNASIIGKIVSDFVFSHEVYGESFYNVNVEVSRLSQASDVLPVTVSERLVDTTALPTGTLVQAIGQIRSYNNFSAGDKKNKLILTLFARELEILNNGASIENNPNNVFINGFICKPPVYRTTPFGREITDVLVAVNRSYNKSDYIPCIAWGRNAKFGGKLNVGDNIKIWGRLQSRTYQKKYETGQVDEKIAYEVSISKLETVEKSDDNIKSESKEL